MANVLGELFQDIANAIRSKTGDTGSMKPAQFPAAISSLSGTDTDEIDQRLDEILGEVVGQSLRYVTIMTEDGAEEIFKIAVYEGYDAENPFGVGALGVPVKESTDTQVFTYTGLSRTPGGEADPAALLNVTEDRTVYLAFKSAIRFYTVRFFNGDELEKTASVMYNNSAVYTPAAREGWIFRGWEPSNRNITADTDCYARWEEQLDFAASTLSRISEICELGQAAEHFAIDDEREITGQDGETYILRVVGVNLDTKANDGSKAGLTVAITKPGRVQVDAAAWKSELNRKLGTYWDYDDNPKDESYIRYKLNTAFKAKLPEELQNVMKTVRKRTAVCRATGGEYLSDIRESLEDLFIPSIYEIGDGNTLFSENGVVYPGFASKAKRVLYDGTTEAQWYTRTIYDNGGIQYVNYCDSSAGGVQTIQYLTTSRGVYPCFCI